MSVNQDRLNEYAAQFGQTLDGIRQDVADLKQAATDAGADLDFTALDAKLADAQELDSENPGAPVE
jgi:hypothetical protein